MTRMLEDIRREPLELARCLERLIDSDALTSAASLVRSARQVYIVGIGSSWNAALGVASLLGCAGFPATAVDASELLHFGFIHPDSVLLMLSRSGRSIEIVQLVEKARSAGATVIAVTNTRETPLTRAADIAVQLGAPFDHLVSIGMYSLLALGGALIAASAQSEDLIGLTKSLRASFEEVATCAPIWSDQLHASDWLAGDATTYFLARGPSVASCHEARLLWEEAAKAPAAALTTGAFRHGSQEIIRPGVRLAMWIHSSVLRREDLQLASELLSAGVSLLLLGTAIQQNLGDLVLHIPEIPAGWEFVIDVIPMQLAAERLAALRVENCDAFKYCSYIVEAPSGLSGAPPRPLSRYSS